jgi:HK97 family phage major capsid protein
MGALFLQGHSGQMEAEGLNADARGVFVLLFTQYGDVTTMSPEMIAALAEALGEVLGKEVASTPEAVAAALEELKAMLVTVPVPVDGVVDAAMSAKMEAYEEDQKPIKAALGLAEDASPEAAVEAIEALKSAVLETQRQSNGFAKLATVVNSAKNIKRHQVPRATGQEEDGEAKKSRRFGSPSVRNWSKKNLSDGILAIINNDEKALKALGYTIGSNGGWLANREMADELIELFYANEVVIAAGATVVPMSGIETLTYRKQLSGATAYWGGEHQAVPDSEPTYGIVNLNLRELVADVPIATRLLRNGMPNLEQMLKNDIEKAMRLTADHAFLYGTGSKVGANTGMEPLGVRNTPGVTVTPLGANGRVPSPGDYLDGWGRIEDANVPASDSWGMIASPRTVRSINNTTDTTGQLIPVERFTQGYGIYPTTQVRNNYTVGTSTNTSDVFLGAWEYAIVGMGQDVEFVVDESVLRRQRDTLIQAVMYVDFAVAHPEAFQVISGVKA